MVKSCKRFFMYQDNYLTKIGKGLLYFHTGGETVVKLHPSAAMGVN